MKVAHGTETLSVIMEECRKRFRDNIIFKTNNIFKLSNKTTDEFLNMAITKPLIFYVTQSSFSSSQADKNFREFADDIIDTDSIELLAYLNTIGDSQLSQKEIDWIVLTSNKSVSKSLAIQKIMFLDYWQIEKNKQNSSGKINYKQFEKYLSDTLGHSFLKNSIKKFQKFAIYPLLDIKPPQNDLYAYPKLKYFASPNEITVPKDKKIYQYKCPICDTLFSVVLSGHSVKGGRVNTTKMIKQDSQHIEFLCNHENTPYDDMKNLYVEIDKIGNFKLANNNSYDQMFLYFFYRFQKQGDEIKLLDQNNKELYISIIEKFTKE